MSSPTEPVSARGRRALWCLAGVVGVVLAVVAVVAVLIVRRTQQPTPVPLGLRPAGQMALP